MTQGIPNSVCEEIADALTFNAQGLLPAIAQQYDSREILMMAWVNKDALKETLRTGHVCYFSRSRQKLWRKGESSGQTQKLVEMFTDCDRDTVLFMVDQKGVACHTGRTSCFFRKATSKGLITTCAPQIDSKKLYQ